jgi:hypothetical protein
MMLSWAAARYRSCAWWLVGAGLAGLSKFAVLAPKIHKKLQILGGLVLLVGNIV